MRLLADRHIHRLDAFLPEYVDVETYDPDLGIPANAGEYDGLFVRTVTKVNTETIPVPGRLTWVGTASAGTDHLDLGWLNQSGISVGSAAGCNARAVAEYVMTMLLWTAWKRRWTPAGLKIGVVGAGHVGSEVGRMAENLGLIPVLYDPPREQREAFRSATLDEVLDTDIITLHLPKISDGPWKTTAWLDEEKLFSRSRKLLLQASRGGIADEWAINSALHRGILSDVVIDVWQNEPFFDPDLVFRAHVATPHIAGYSEEAKTAATFLALKSWLGKDIPENEKPTATENAAKNTSTLAHLLEEKTFPLPEPLLQDYLGYDSALREIARGPADLRAAAFLKLRNRTPYRTEYAHCIGMQNPWVALLSQ